MALRLAARKLDDSNSIARPKKVVPRTENVIGGSADFTLEFVACSVMLLKLKSNKPLQFDKRQSILSS